MGQTRTVATIAVGGQDIRLSWITNGNENLAGERYSLHQYIEKAMESVGWLGLGDLQEEQIQKDIQAAIKKAGNTRCQDASTLPLLIQIWTTGFDATDLCGGSLRSLDSPRKMQSGVGFFIIEKTVDGTENTPSETYRLVDVRIYG